MLIAHMEGEEEFAGQMVTSSRLVIYFRVCSDFCFAKDDECFVLAGCLDDTMAHG